MISDAKKKKKERLRTEMDHTQEHTHASLVFCTHICTHTLAQILSASWHERRVTSNLGVIQVK